MVPLANTSAPLGAVYLTAWTVPSMPGGRDVRPLAALVLEPARIVARRLACCSARLTPAGWRLRYWD